MSDWLNWQERLKELSRDTAENEWPDPNLQKIENNLLEEASETAGIWLSSAWKIIKETLKHPSESKYEKIIRVTEKSPVDVEIILDKIIESSDVADKRAKHIDRLPDRGPWVPVPEGEHFVKPLRLHKQAEWIARQSAASKMREWAVGMREDVRWQVAQAIREGISEKELAVRLEARWDRYGQNFQTIAVSEMSMAYSDAALTHYAGKHVVIPVIGDDRVCASCKKLLEGKVFYVSPVPIENPTKQQLEQYLWPGKSNVGRKRDDWKSCLPLHPRCRHVAVKYRGGDPYEYRTKRR